MRVFRILHAARCIALLHRGLRHEYALGIFPVIQLSFPDSPKGFPVMTLREIC